MRKWRDKPTKYLATRAISKEELPKLLIAMNEDGVMATITPDGIVWTVGDYKVSKKAVADVWGLTVSQMNRVMDYIYSYDPFYSFLTQERPIHGDKVYDDPQINFDDED